MVSASPPARPAKRRIIRHSLLANMFILGVILAVQLSGLWSWAAMVDDSSFVLPQTVLLTDVHGGELRRIYMDKDRLELTDDAFSPFLQQAVVAIEDERFFERGCVDLRAIVRAAVANVSPTELQGASTITQQLVGNLLLDRSNRSLSRKAMELLLACRLEHVASRQRILGLYLNHMAFGGTIYGAEEASRTYFGVSARDLTLSQSVVLAAMLQRPTYFSPYGTHVHTSIARDTARAIREGGIGSAEELPPDSVTIGLLGSHFLTATGSVYVRGRADLVLEAMRRSGFIDALQQAAAERELLSVRFEERPIAVALPYFALYVQQQLRNGDVRTDKPCDALVGGCIVRTTLDPQLQSL
ncbi:MAG: transglycosylase domain-containing protein, partial [Candidatus Peribacteraceae bacterium]|nr:transglycosylase domain-containing protein [Candidatus Peribacteraceae bacterium]